MDEEQNHIRRAKSLVRHYANMDYCLSPEGWVTLDKIEILWYAQIFKDWMAFVHIPDLDEKRCYLVSYNADKQKTVIDIFEFKEGVVNTDEV